MNSVFNVEAFMKSTRNWFAVIVFALAAGFVQLSTAGDREGCPVTKAPDPPFVPPLPYRAGTGNVRFLYGTPSLWSVVYPRWQMHGFRGSKLPFFRQGYDSRNERNPDLTVVARRLDGPSQTVRPARANMASVDGRIEGMFMVTGLEIPVAGCWEIAARYAPSPDEAIRTLTYTVWVVP
jgi:hypothetical protein